jgi:hypothetical protein
MGAAETETDVLLMAARIRARRVGFMMTGAGDAGEAGCVSFDVAGLWGE